MLKILILSHEFPPLGGGAGRAAYNIAKELIKMGDEVDVLTTSYNKLPSFEVIDDINIHRIYGKRRNSLDNNVIVTMSSYLIIGMVNAIKMFKKEQYDVIHCFFTIPAGLLGIVLRKIYRIPVILSLRGSDVPFHNPDYFRFIRFAVQPLFKFIWKKSSKVVALSKGLQRTAKRTLRNYDYAVIYNGVDTNKFKPIQGKYSTSKNNIIRLITVSRLVKRKGIQYLLQAIAELRRELINFQIKLLIVGDGNYRKVLEGLTAKLRLKDNVTFYGICPNDKLPELYNSTDIFILPSLTESFGQAIGEAMACELPIIGTTVGGIPEVVIDGENGILVQHQNVPELKLALHNLATNPELRTKMKQKNARRIKNHFNWQITAKQYREIYIKYITHSC